MTSHEHLTKSARRNQYTVYLIAGMYVAIGLLLTGYSTISGEMIIGFVGLMIVALAAGAAVVLLTTLRLGERLSCMMERSARIDESLVRIEAALAGWERERAKSDVTMVDLSAVGKGEPMELAGAVLDRNAFPRLVAAMNGSAEQALAESDVEIGQSEPHTEAGLETEPSIECATPSPVADICSASSKNLHRQWTVALREGDVRVCREVFSAMVDTVDPDMVVEYRRALEALVARTDKRLREAFSRCVRESDFAGALAVGDEICEALPDSRIARDFLRAKPHLLRHLGQTSDEPATDAVAAGR